MKKISWRKIKKKNLTGGLKLGEDEKKIENDENSVRCGRLQMKNVLHD